MKEEFEEFLEERVKDILLHGDHPDQLISQTKDDIVMNSVAEVVEWANEIKQDQGLFKVKCQKRYIHCLCVSK